MREELKRLKLAKFRERFEDLAGQAAEEGWSHIDYLGRLVKEELLAREENQLRRRMKWARFPFEKSLEQFDFRFRPELKKQVFQRYIDDSFVYGGKSLVFIGPAGTGKTHLSVAIGLKLITRGFKVRCVTVQELINKALESNQSQRRKLLKPLMECDVLILDELGYLPAEDAVGPLLYELISNRYEKKATLVTSNKSLGEWGKILGDSSLAGALIDRLLHHGEVYYLSGDSYRMRGKQLSRKPMEEPEKGVRSSQTKNRSEKKPTKRASQ